MVRHCRRHVSWEVKARDFSLVKVRVRLYNVQACGGPYSPGGAECNVPRDRNSIVVLEVLCMLERREWRVALRGPETVTVTVQEDCCYHS